MTYDELMTTVRRSKYDDWVLLDSTEEPTLVLKADLNVRVVRRVDDLPPGIPPPRWATKFPCHSVVHWRNEIMYGVSLVEVFHFWYGDGGKCNIPPSDVKGGVSRKNYELVQAVSDHPILSSMKQAGLVLED